MRAKLGQVFLVVLYLQEGLLGLLSLLYWLVDYVLISRNADLADQLFLSKSYVFLGSSSFLLKTQILPLATCLPDCRSPSLQTLVLRQATIHFLEKVLDKPC